MTFLGMRPSDALAIIDGASGMTISFQQLFASTVEIGRHLDRSKQIVFLLCSNDTISFMAYAAIRLAGHAVALLDGSRSLADQADVLDGYRARWVMGPPGTATTLRGSGLRVERAGSAFGGEIVALVGSRQPELDRDLAVLLATSATTGSRKYVRLSEANVEANARSIATYLGLTPDERPVTSLPLHYAFGLSVLNSHWLSGAAVVVTSQTLLHRSFWATVAEQRCTSFAGVPYTYQQLERIGYRDMHLPAMRTMQQAGGAMDPKVTALYAEHMASKDGRLFVMYGQTEATARMTYVPPDRLMEKLGSAGIPIPGGRLSIDGTESRTASGHVIGEVIYEGPNVMLGYANRWQDLAAGDQLRGVLRTGDIGYLDADGFLYLTGRCKRIAKVFGVRISLDEVEAMLRESGPAAVVATDDAVWGFCEFGNDESLLALCDSITRRLRLHRSALKLRRVSDMPVHESGKTDYARLERWIRGQDGGPLDCELGYRRPFR